ncbi:site-specific DNA-methyltransferase [Shewanella loihica]|uniref:DNA methylase N-4/N-6 domain protein n=1 Tax=Shewanella loihica (strain ATCC BAA-1088 / PV-4) TaxID=323850 RepID=A3QCD2_SHELP|nr:DNA methyltransferase [Shewanella loihica]ABO23130.1 DNA methylase N-4/N-6 domain protein [Shewanella loihica PV-4]
MSRLTDLLAKAKAKDSQLGADLEREFKVLSSRLSFGLNFERHSPEAVELPLRSIRKGDKVRVLPERGSAKKGDQRLWQVKAIHKAQNIADLELLDTAEPEMQSAPLSELIVVAEFRDTIYPGLVSTGKVTRGGDKPFHSVINGENYHVLKALTYTHRGKIDAIYIDPPYNSGAKDWKYNNDYVEGDDLYRHSKWLAMMERRLFVAKELLNPADSVLIVTIDEKEYLRLGLLLEQVFPEAKIQMVSSVINPFGVARAGQFARVDEYIFIVNFGQSVPVQTPIQTLQVGDSMQVNGDEDLAEQAGENLKKVDKTTYWFSFMRAGSNSSRSHSPGCFYPIFVSKDGAIKAIGHPLPKGESKDNVKTPAGTYAAWPVNEAGGEAVWQASHENAKQLLASGYIRSGRFNKKLGRHSITYLREGTVEAIANGLLTIADGEINRVVEQTRTYVGKSTWNIRSHNATSQGTKLLGRILPRRKFPYPKSLYAVEDALRFFVSDKPDAIILDFFSGSGTTAHAVMRLNRQDGGRRQCISVTNNEVAADEQKALREQGLRPGDAEWEKYGICDYITKPRVAAAITGKTPSGDPIKGDYKFTDEFPMADGFEENAEFFTQTYEAKNAVNHNLAYARIAPLLWLRAGAKGSRIDELPVEGWAVADTYGLLNEVDEATPFIDAVGAVNGLRIAYIVTDDDRRFQAIAKRLPEGVEPVRLYESYLSNFSFANGE